jgi:hypothetical protein
MSDHHYDRARPRTLRPLGNRPQERFVSATKASRHFPFSAFSIQPLAFPAATPRKPGKFVHKNLRKPQQKPPSSTLVNPEFFSRGAPLPACRFFPAT